MASEPEKKIAKIKSTFLGYEDHGILTFFLHLDYGDSGQGAGGFCLGGEYTDKVIRGVLSACGVDQWEQLPGRTVYALIRPGGGIGYQPDTVYGIEPLPTERGEKFLFSATAGSDE